MKQQTFSDVEYCGRKRKTKREEFLEIMDEIIPWDEWVSIIVPYYPSGKRGRPPKGIEKMLRMYLLQVWFNLSDEGTEDAIYDSYVEKALVSLNKKEPFGNFQKNKLKDYDVYMGAILSFRQHFGFDHYSIKQLDQYLWQLGKWYFNQYGLSYKYYNREAENPYINEDYRSHFWHGEMMFVTTHQSVGGWKDEGKNWLKNATEQIKNLAARLTPEQFGVVAYISALFGKWCPYDDQLWLVKY